MTATADRFRLAGLVVTLALAGCLGDAPHENPLDPLSDMFRDEGAVEGRVTGVYPPFEGRPGVRVVLLPLDGGTELATRTGSDGGFQVGAVRSGRYAVLAMGEGYRSASDTVTVEVGRAVETTLALDAFPVVTSQVARTVHIERWVPDVPVFRIEVEATVTDPDRPDDLATVALVVDELGFRVPMEATGTGTYALTLDGTALPGGQVQSLLGRPLQIEGTDQLGNAALGPPFSLVRVIEQTPLTASPQGFEFIAQNPPTLTWRAAQLPFAFTYRVDLWLVDAAGIPNLVLSEDGIPPSTLTFDVPGPLVAGDYYWTIWVVDAAGNRSRSKEAGFRVAG